MYITESNLVKLIETELNNTILEGELSSIALDSLVKRLLANPTGDFGKAAAAVLSKQLADPKTKAAAQAAIQRGGPEAIKAMGGAGGALVKAAPTAIAKAAPTAIAKAAPKVAATAAGGLSRILGPVSTGAWIGSAVAPYLISMTSQAMGGDKSPQDVTDSASLGWAYLTGGEEAAYAVWAKQQTEAGKAPPSYEQYKQQKDKMAAQEIESAKKVATAAGKQAQKAASGWDSYIGGSDTKQKIKDLWSKLTAAEAISEGLSEVMMGMLLEHYVILEDLKGYDPTFESWKKWYMSSYNSEWGGKHKSPKDVVSILQGMLDGQPGAPGEPEAASPVGSRAPDVLSPGDKGTQSDRAETNIKFYTDRRDGLKKAIGSMMPVLRKLKDALPKGASFENPDSKFSRVRGSGPRKNKYNEYLAEVLKLVAQYKKASRSLETSEKYKDRVGKASSLEESVINRWKKLIR